MCRAASNARAARRIRTRFVSSSPACGRSGCEHGNETARGPSEGPPRRKAARQERPLRPVRRPLRARNVDAGARAADARRRAHPAVGRVPSGARARAQVLGRAAYGADGRATLERALGRRRVAQARRLGAHGRAQDQQRHRPSVAREGARRHARRRRDGRGPARRRGGLPCTVYMGEIDVARQAPNVDRMRRFGATVVAVTSGDRTLRAAIDEAIRDWVSDPVRTYYLLGSAIGPHPYPYLVRQLQAVIGREARAQMLADAGGLPDAVFACVGGGSNAIGMFHGFLADAEVKIFGVEAGGRGPELGEHSATLSYGKPG